MPAGVKPYNPDPHPPHASHADVRSRPRKLLPETVVVLEYTSELELVHGGFVGAGRHGDDEGGKGGWEGAEVEKR
jgi:hypothetical protein